MLTQPSIWGIILAGGEGKRLQHYIQTIYTDNRPKQYATLVGTKSMLGLTLDRVRKLIPTEHILTIVNKGHLHFAEEDLSFQPKDTIIVQPYCRETASGILLPVLHVYMRDPTALVAVFPSDHFIVGEDSFMNHIEAGFHFVQQNPGYIVILGVSPEYPDVEYGWIEKGDRVFQHQDKAVYQVKKFWEKPSGVQAFTLHQNGYLWNTFVMIGSSAMFLRLFHHQLPDLYFSFHDIMPLLRTPAEEPALQHVFSSLPAVNFSRMVLEKSTNSLCVLQLEDVYWSDWGNERRILYDAEKLNIQLSSATASMMR